MSVQDKLLERITFKCGKDILYHISDEIAQFSKRFVDFYGAGTFEGYKTIQFNIYGTQLDAEQAMKIEQQVCEFFGIK